MMCCADWSLCICVKSAVTSLQCFDCLGWVAQRTCCFIPSNLESLVNSSVNDTNTGIGSVYHNVFTDVSVLLCVMWLFVVVVSCTMSIQQC